MSSKQVPDLALSPPLTGLEEIHLVAGVVRDGSGNVTNHGNSRRETLSAVAAFAQGAASSYATRAAMSAISSPAVGNIVQLGEAGREGEFVVDLAANWTGYGALATIDPQQGVFVPSTADSTKVYVRLQAVREWVLNVRWFGAKLDFATDDHVAVQGAVALSYALRSTASLPGISYGNGGGPAVVIPGLGYMGANILTLNHTFKLFGFSWGGPSGVVSALRWADGVTGIENVGRAQIEGLALIGGFAGTAEGEHHAIHATLPFAYRNLLGGEWAGDFMNLDCSGGGNVNGVVGENVWVSNCRDALNVIAGSDNSAGTHKNWNVDTCRRWGINDQSFLGNNHDGHEIANCGLSSWSDGVTKPCSVVSYLGNRYCVKVGQAVGASTNAPSGTTADNTWWYYMQAGGAASGLGIIAWTSGINVREGGSYTTNSAGNANNLFSGCYHEGGQAFAQIFAPSLIDGGSMRPNVRGVGALYGTASNGGGIAVSGDLLTSGNIEAVGTQTDLGPVSGAAADFTCYLHNTNVNSQIFGQSSAGLIGSLGFYYGTGNIYNVSNNGWFHKFRINGSDVAVIDAAGITITPLTVATLPAAGTVGRRTFVTDATVTTFASVVAGSGTNKVPVYDDGVNWRIG